MTIKEIIMVGLTGVAVICTVISLIKPKSTRKNKISCDIVSTDTDTGQVESDKSDSEPTKSVAKTFLEKLKTIATYVMSAEDVYTLLCKGKSGELKLKDVLTKLKIDCLTNNEEYDETTFTDIVNTIINLTKKVNVKNSTQMENQIKGVNL